MAKTIRGGFAKLVARGENPTGVVQETANGTERFPFGGWNNLQNGANRSDDPADWPASNGHGFRRVINGSYHR